MKYKVNYSGFMYVEADSADEALEKARDDDTEYEEMKYGEVEEVEEFYIEL